jgi:hypothetical protein
MGAFIILEDGRGWIGANWAYDAIIQSIADELAQTNEGRALASWLLEQRCEVLGPGLGRVDVRELSTDSRCRFRDACRRSLDRIRARGPVGWSDPSFFPAWLVRFQHLIDMWASIDRGEPAGALNDLKGTIDPTGERHGPGWESV